MNENDEKDKPNAYGFMDRFRNAVLGATMADQPAIMTASGWRQNEKGDYVQDQQNDPHVIQLRDNLAAEGIGVMLGEFGLPAAYGIYNLGVRSLGKAGNNWARAKLISRSMNDVVDEGQQYFGKVKYYGPTMGKTTAAKTNPDLVDFDDFTREAKNNLAKELNISTRVLQSDPKYVQAYQEMLEKQLDSWRRNPLNTDKTLVISKKGLADKNVYNNEPSIPDRQTFIQRQRNRGETDDANSNDWYNMLMKQNPNLRIDNRFVSEIEYNPHYIGFYPVNNHKTISKSVISNSNTGELLYTPDELIKSGDFARGKEMAIRFFDHPIVQQSYKHNQELAKRLGITIPDKNASEVVKQPVKVTYKKLDNEIANVAQSHYGDPDAVITMDWSMYPLKDLRQAVIHENLHRGFYSAPLRLPAMSKEYYNNVYIPEYRFWEWKTKKLLKPEYHNGYLADIHGGEAGTNFIDLGRDLGLKLGQKYPGYETVKAMLENYKGFKRFMIPQLNDSKAGMRHVWDAMTGKYFTPTAIGIGTSSLIPSDKKDSKILIKRKIK